MNNKLLEQLEQAINDKSELSIELLVDKAELIIKEQELEDKNKRLTLTDKQYKTWIDTDVYYITTEQLETLYGITKQKQAGLRSHIKDPLPSFQLHGKGKHYYNKVEVDKWLSNYKRDSIL